MQDGAAKAPYVYEHLGETVSRPTRFGSGDFFVELADDPPASFDALCRRLSALPQPQREAVASYVQSVVFCQADRPEPAAEADPVLAAAAVVFCVLEDRNYPGLWQGYGGFYLPARAFVAAAHGLLGADDYPQLCLPGAKAAVAHVDPVVFDARCRVCQEVHPSPASMC